jgi:U3 small nucleolar RNA-associated protein 23
MRRSAQRTVYVTPQIISRMNLYLLINAQAEQDALGPSTSERDILSAATPQVEHVPKKKRGPKGPNPLSVKKKTRKQSVQEPKKANFTRPAGDEQAEVRGKRKRDESDSNDEASSPKPKRRRRHKSHSQDQGENV